MCTSRDGDIRLHHVLKNVKTFVEKEEETTANVG
jgi:hypothetical protein